MENVEKLVPQMRIGYLFENGSIKIGEDFENVPKDACGAQIMTLFPMVLPNGRFVLMDKSYKLIIGQKYLINEILIDKPKSINGYSITEEEMAIMQKYLQNDILEVVVGKCGVQPYETFDVACESRKEMEEIIHDISESFKSVKFSAEDVNKKKDKINIKIKLF